MLEHFFQCPHCWEPVSVLVDTSVPSQTYVEDCEVCCNPIEFSVRCNPGEITAFQAQPLQQ